jgi:hypothetical protein
MRLPQLKRRRLLSNPLVPLLAPSLLVTSLKPSRISTCTSCHRTIKPSPPLVCARFVVVPFAPMPKSIMIVPRRRCSASTCAICVRTCTGGPLPSSGGTGTRNPSPHRSPSPPPLGNSNGASPSRRRRPCDEDIDTTLMAKSSEREREGSGCGRTICRICCLEILQRWCNCPLGRPHFAHLS